jgi:fumarylacetoacetate (FAA) hydrolase
MKLATYRDGSRDGQLVVVSRDLTTAHYATHAAHTVRQALDDWNFISPQLQDLSLALNQGKARHAFPFDPTQCMAPLPRATECVRTCARRGPDGPGDPDAAGEAPATPTEAWSQLGGGALLGARERVAVAHEDGLLEAGAGWAVFLSDVPLGCDPARALEGVRLLSIAHEWVLQRPAEPAGQVPAFRRGLDALQRQLGLAFSPVALTPDELGPAWTGGRLHGVLQASLNGAPAGTWPSGESMALHMGQLVALLAANRPLSAGSVVFTGSLGRIGEPAAHPHRHACALGDTVGVVWTHPSVAHGFGAIEQDICLITD